MRWARKTGYGNDAQRPKLAFMNPVLTFHACRRYQTAAGITDMYCHLLERFFDDVGAGARDRQPEPVRS